MAKLIPFRKPLRNPHFQNGSVASPLVLRITRATAANIRRDALWHGRTPEQFAIDWLNGYAPERSV